MFCYEALFCIHFSFFRIYNNKFRIEIENIPATTLNESIQCLSSMSSIQYPQVEGGEMSFITLTSVGMGKS